jgi:hypothetical protein
LKDESTKEILAISKVVLLRCGTKVKIPGYLGATTELELQAGELRESAAPSKVDLAHLGNHGCMVENIDSDSKWSNGECTERFKALFPMAFEYALSQSKEGKPLWKMAVKERQKLRIVPIDEPQGCDLHEYKSDPKLGPKQLMIFIGTF